MLSGNSSYISGIAWMIAEIEASSENTDVVSSILVVCSFVLFSWGFFWCFFSFRFVFCFCLFVLFHCYNSKQFNYYVISIIYLEVVFLLNFFLAQKHVHLNMDTFGNKTTTRELVPKIRTQIVF